jgi:hypothetical protein
VKKKKACSFAELFSRGRIEIYQERKKIRKANFASSFRMRIDQDN